MAPQHQRPSKRTCKGCGRDITKMGIGTQRCGPCHSQLSARPPRRAGIEYEMQSNSEDGQTYKIFYGMMVRRVRKICHKCKLEDAEVRGRWAPIFSSMDSFGHETKPILLCLDCYEKEYERY